MLKKTSDKTMSPKLSISENIFLAFNNSSVTRSVLALFETFPIANRLGKA